jgi:diguanylate cyclase (GGDEF)-like protein
MKYDASGMAPGGGALPSPQKLESLRQHVLEQLGAVLESLTRTKLFAASISDLVRQTHAEITQDLGDSLALAADPALRAALERAVDRCARLDRSFSILIGERQRRWRQSSAHLKRVIGEFDQTIECLTATLIEKNLLERQSQVLESIVLSHERVAQWKEFVQEILEGFHNIFPFNFFFIAFAEEHGLSLYIYYLGDYSEEIRKAARQKLAREMLSQLRLPVDAPLDIEEFPIPQAQGALTLDDINMITVPVPEHMPGISGLLGIAYASVSPLTAQEGSIIRSLLSVMVMVVGSSKVLSRTLSELEYYAIHDPLTGLHNRRHFNEMLKYEVSRSERHQHHFCVLLMDLDDFKDINDSYGHPTGDQVLRQIAETVRALLRKGDVATRIGGDEFAVILPETGLEGAKKVGELLRQKLRSEAFTEPGGKQFHITASVGIVNYPEDAQNMSDLMAGVDIALYRAKDLGKDGVCALVSAEHHLQQSRDSRLYAEELRIALAEGRIVPYFQPIVDCRTGQRYAYESVARLITPDGQTIAAGQFIETIEKYLLAPELDRAIIRQSILAIRERMSATGQAERVFINLSAQEIQGRGILGYAEELCQKHAVPPSCIVFEITEREAIGDMSNMRKFLSNLRKKGFAFALDDFGSGYNSFHYLRELRFEYVKIDGAFVRNMVNSHVDRALVRNLSYLCADLGIATVGEFVESQEILKILREMGVHFAQGFHISLPLKRLGDDG